MGSSGGSSSRCRVSVPLGPLSGSDSFAVDVLPSVFPKVYSPPEDRYPLDPKCRYFLCGSSCLCLWGPSRGPNEDDDNNNEARLPETGVLRFVRESSTVVVRVGIVKAPPVRPPLVSPGGGSSLRSIVLSDHPSRLRRTYVCTGLYKYLPVAHVSPAHSHITHTGRRRYTRTSAPPRPHSPGPLRTVYTDTRCRPSFSSICYGPRGCPFWSPRLPLRVPVLLRRGERGSWGVVSTYSVPRLVPFPTSHPPRTSTPVPLTRNPQGPHGPQVRLTSLLRAGGPGQVPHADMCDPHTPMFPYLRPTSEQKCVRMHHECLRGWVGGHRWDSSGLRSRGGSVTLGGVTQICGRRQGTSTPGPHRPAGVVRTSSSGLLGRVGRGPWHV